MVNRVCVAVFGALAACGDVGGEPETSTGSSELLAPEVWIAKESVTLGNGDAADIYVPAPPAPWRDLAEDAFPVVVVLQGGGVAHSQYELFARRVARHGFAVIVPNHLRVLGPPGSPALALTEAGVVTSAIDRLAVLDADPASQLHQIVDPSRVGLVGHSFGGVVGMQAISGSCRPPFCTPPFTLPAEVGAAAFFGTHLVQPPLLDIPTNGVAIALLRGSADGRTLPTNVDATYGVLDDARALITVHGANHFGITNDNAPAGAQPDPNAQSISQSDSIRAIGTWTARWLRAELAGDPVARFWIHTVGGSLDGVVTIDDVEE